MDLGESLAITLSATAATAIVASAYIQKPLRSFLAVHLRDEELATFWAAYTQVFAVLLPLMIELVVFAVRPIPRTPDTVFIIGLMTWGLGGLLMAIAILGILVLLFGGFRSQPVFVDPEQVDDLNRLLERVRELRAREIVRKADALRQR